MKRIGLTGSIGSGKSTVAELLIARGIAVLDADAVARRVSSRADVLEAVSSQLGAQYVLPDGLNRPALAELVFAQPNARAILNAIIHPAVREEMAWLEDALEIEGANAVVQDIPLLFENGLEKLFDAVILVDAPLETRIARVMRRDPSMTRKAVLARDAAQMPTLEKRARADFVLKNDGDEAALEAQLEALLVELDLLEPSREGVKYGLLAGILQLDDKQFKSADEDIKQMFADSKGLSTNDD